MDEQNTKYFVLIKDDYGSTWVNPRHVAYVCGHATYTTITLASGKSFSTYLSPEKVIELLEQKNA